MNFTSGWRRAFAYAKWKLEKQTNKLVSGEEDHSDSSGNEVRLNEHKMNFLLLHKHPSVSKGAVDGSGVTVCNFLIRSALCISVANSWVWGVPNLTADLLVWGLFVRTLGKQTSNDPRQELGLWFPADRIWSDSFACEKDHTLMLMVPSPSYKFTGLTGNGSAAFCDSSLTGEVIGSPGEVRKDTVDKNWYRTNAEDRRVCAVKWCVKYLWAGVWRASLVGRGGAFCHHERVKATVSWKLDKESFVFSSPLV